jgi:hypothetical protein
MSKRLTKTPPSAMLFAHKNVPQKPQKALSARRCAEMKSPPANTPNPISYRNETSAAAQTKGATFYCLTPATDQGTTGHFSTA